MNVAFPLRVDDQRRTASSSSSAHVREMIEQVLFTRPGERVGRPTFGCNLLALVFENGSDGLGAAAQQMIMGALDQWLGELIEVRAVEVKSEDSLLTVRVSYAVRATAEAEVSEFTQRL